MKTGLNKYRISILAGFGLLILVLGLMVTNLMAQLRDLSTAAGDNTQWNISQLDAEFANLNATLSDRMAGIELSDNEVRLRLDIALSRLNTINSGRAGLVFGGNEEARALIAPVDLFTAEAIAISDQLGPITQQDLKMLHTKVQEIRPTVRKIALLGLTLSAKQSERQRNVFANQLARTGGIAIALLVLMGALMVLLDRLLRRAALRDAELLTSTKQLASTVSASLDAIVTANDQGVIIGFNASAENVFGWSSDEIIGQTMESTFIPHHLRDAHITGMKRYLKTGTPQVVDGGRVELSALRKSGEEFPVELNITSTEDDDGPKFIAYIRDISDRKIIEQKLIDARDRAERTDKAKSQFLTVMSHEMRTPLNGILGVLDLMKTTSLSPEQERYIQIATASSEILLEQTNEALDITRIETGTLQLTSQNFDLPQVMETLVDVLEPLAREKQLSLTLNIENTMRLGFFGDSSRLRQILTNLIGNAIKFTDSGHIRLDVSGIHGPLMSSVKFAVSDTGAGIAPEHQEQVFEDFVALAHGEGRQTRGDGLGLSISRKIARQMGGDLNLVSDLGVGSTFTLTAPLQRQEAHLQNSSTPHSPDPLIAKSCNVLIVEDNTINRKVLGDMLGGMGHSVKQAVDGIEGLKQAEGEKFDIIFMDISMPEMDGIEATRRLRAGGGPNAQARIIGLTAHGQEEFRDAAEQAGMNSFHTKPIRLGMLHDIMAEATPPASSLSPQTAAPSDALRELGDALGYDKVNDIGTRFFDELDVFCDQEPQRDGEDGSLAAASHKMKGAAALLGLRELEAPLAELEQAAQHEEAPMLTARIEALQELAKAARAGFAERLARSIP
ncbi:ATP-binding protein [uncultured Litoreibacter sp.]|uniref:ATP-binding protein n=1 Tax=uncultured Litoreibacter sp. TaxID=1392394 RepID=UPI00261CF145|nr:ATP-binding protein [uncultured Litoreibacter sp.]